MKVLAIAPEPFFTPRGTPLSVYYRSRVMAERGAQVDLLTYGEGADIDAPGVRVIRIPRLRWLEPIKTGPSLGKAVLDALMILWTLALLCRRRYDVVHAHEEAVFWCRLLKPLFRFKLAYDMHSSLPQQLANFQFSRSRLLMRAFEALERSSLKKSDAIITICPALRDHVISLNGCAARQVMIENSLFEPVKLKTTRETNGEAADEAEPTSALPPSPRVVYSGTLEAYQGIDILLQAFTHLSSEGSRARLLIVGGSPAQVRQYQQRAEALGLRDRVTLTGRLPQAMAQTYRQRADVLVSPRVAGTNTPLKIYELLASGRPFVATNIAAHTQVLSESVCFLAEPTATGLATAIKQALNNPKDAAQRAAAAKTLYAQAYAREAYEAKIDRFMELVR